MKNTELEAIIEKHDLVGKSYAEVCVILSDKSWGDILQIIGYINQHYAIKPDVMRELKKEENVRRILEGGNDLSKELYLTYEDEDGKYCIRVTSFEEEKGFGFDFYGEWKDGKQWAWITAPEYWRKSTPEEIEQMLVKKLEADGLKVGCVVDKTELPVIPYKSEIKKIEYLYTEKDDLLSCGGVTVYIKGKFAKIIQPELTIEQKMEILWNERNAKLI